MERQLHRANVASLQLGREGEEEGRGVTKARIAQLEERLEEAQEKRRETENQVQAPLFSLNINSYSSSFCCLSLPLFHPPSEGEAVETFCALL